jgi:hypothetical protein
MLRGRLRQRHVPAVDRIETAPKKTNIHRFCPDLRRQFRVFRRQLQVFVPPSPACTNDFSVNCIST